MNRRADGTQHRDRANSCFGCGEANPDGLRLAFTAAPGDPRCVQATTQVAARFAGAPNMLHGGIVATLLDEAMTKVNARLGLTAVTTRLTVAYTRPVPHSAPITIRGRHVRRRGALLYNTAEILDERDRLLATAKGRFTILPREVVERMGRI